MQLAHISEAIVKILLCFVQSKGCHYTPLIDRICFYFLNINGIGIKCIVAAVKILPLLSMEYNFHYKLQVTVLYVRCFTICFGEETSKQVEKGNVS